MEKFNQLQKIKDLYAGGKNIMEYLRQGKEFNEIEDIIISYDLQSGTYIQDFANDRNFVEKSCSSLARIINNVGGGAGKTIMEVGVGEATTPGTVVQFLENKPTEILGFDISWSRLKFAKNFLKDLKIGGVKLFVGNLFEIPLPDNSVDIVYTSHSIEPNGGRETEALKELYRVTKKYLILLEPSYELADSASRKRMKRHGYVTRLHEAAQELNLKIIDFRLFKHTKNLKNPTGLIIIEKLSSESNNPNLICPVSHERLSKVNNSLLYAKKSFLAYPVIDKIPCLLKENSMPATHLLTDYKKFKEMHDIKI